jgi:hypothetical protein
MTRAAFVLSSLLLAACASAPARPPPRDPDSTRARAALATLIVDNRSIERLTVVYRFAARGGAEVAVGQSPARAVMQMAPVPAGEPLVLIARTDAGRELVLPPRTFTIDGLWTWVVPADTRFTTPDTTATAS